MTELRSETWKYNEAYC